MFGYTLDDHVELRPLAIEHARAMFEITDRSRDRLRKWLPWVDAVTEVNDTVNYIKGAMKQAAENGGFSAGIWVREELAGTISFHEIDWNNRSVSIGYWLDQHFTGQGLMTSACRAFTDHALMRMGLNRVEIRCATANHRSRAIPERLGFVLEGVIREAEKLPQGYVNHAVYGMIQSEWKRMR
ncbi:GNAT family protein [Paenibacillus sp. FSL W7-1279]|uniref:GNAT family N-acetyltransferase n=1 Tax=Paenibacillus TaxID=44249 RepID=UPI000DC3755D|nr:MULTISPECIES: GNAT family protein [Paenibacillus]MBU5349214.1 GNAT family N-acetyltransferase [Paenibacillus lautus]MBX4152167.1 GNAT family N-acetyltransferase [Paenibacillus lautus]MCT1402544.1 GNAT family N-acetyltransferase [Paenibacillus sp. p3-SID867]RAR42503.1 RimJ/RimL family protein N-acetyltransferase [Paenibacillus sp. MDMC362]